MTQRKHKIDLQYTEFPMLSEQQTRTIIVGASRVVESSAAEKPGIAYCHNVMPSQYGMDSVGFTVAIPAPTDSAFVADVDDTRIIFGDEGSRIYFTWDLVGNIYALLPLATEWTPLPEIGFGIKRKDFTANSVTIATVNGISYIHFALKQTFIFEESSNSLQPVTLIGLDITTVIGLAASSGYLVAYTDEAIAWSSTIVPTDFVPSEVTGAGGGKVAGTEGKIQFILSNSLGLLVYTFANVVAGTYTGNVLYPFKFRPVDNSKGGLTLDRVAYEANASEQFAYTKGGLQSITSTGAKNILPEVTDFLSGKRFEDFDEVTNEYVGKNLNTDSTMLKKIKYIASRYLVISYGLPKSAGGNGYFTHAIIYDTSLNKVGKVKIDHVDVFEFIAEQTEIAKETIAFLIATGEVKTLHSSVLLESNGVLILGKIQQIHERMITLLEVEAENVPIGSIVDCIDMAALDGKKDITLFTGFVANKAGNYTRYAFRNTAKNHSLIFKGRFNLTTVLVTYYNNGSR